MENSVSLFDAEPGRRYVITALPEEKRLRMRLMSLGLIICSLIRIVCRLGDYVVVQVFDSASVGLDGKAAAGISVEPR